MDKKAILAVVISFGIWIGWQKLYLEPYQKSVAEAQKHMTTTVPPENKTEKKVEISPEKPTSAAAVSIKGTKTATIGNEKFSLNSSNGASLVSEWSLTHYFKTLESKDGVVSLEDVTGFPNQIEVRIHDPHFADLGNKLWSEPVRNNQSVTSNLDTSAIHVSRKIDTSDGYLGNISFHFQFKVDPPKYVFIDLNGSPKRPNDTEGGILGRNPDKVHVTFRDANGRKSTVAASLKEPIESFTGVRWMGVDTKYFVLALVPDEELRKNSGIQVFNSTIDGKPVVKGSLVVPTDGKRDLTVNTKVYFGPKHLDDLEAADPMLRDAIDFGWTSFLAIPLLKALRHLYAWIGNYGLAIILLTLGIKAILYPLTYKSMKNMAKMSKLQPQLNALREKYKDNKEKLNQEMMSFMKVNGYNPMGGCFPIALQMPIFFALYRVLFNSIELYQAPFGFWIRDLSSPDPFYVTPIILAGLMYFQQKLSPSTATDPTQQKVMQMMPVLFAVFMLMLPAGLNIYMVVNSITSIGQQWFLNRKFGIVPGGKKVVPAS